MFFLNNISWTIICTNKSELGCFWCFCVKFTFDCLKIRNNWLANLVTKPEHITSHHANRHLTGCHLNSFWEILMSSMTCNGLKAKCSKIQTSLHAAFDTTCVIKTLSLGLCDVYLSESSKGLRVNTRCLIVPKRQGVTKGITSYYFPRLWMYLMSI